MGISNDGVILIHTIATEKVMYKCDIDGALKLFMDGLGCTKEQANLLLKCDLCLIDNGDGTLTGKPRAEMSEEELKEYPKITPKYALNHILHESINILSMNYDDVGYFYRTLDRISDMLLRNDSYKHIEANIDMGGIKIDGTCSIKAREIPLEVQKYIEFIDENDINDQRFYECVHIISFAKKIFENKTKYIDCITWLEKNYELDDDDKSNIRKLRTFIADMVEFYEFCIKYAKKAEVSENAIRQSDIRGKYDAGYLSPEGRFYGVCGEVNQLLHLSLADRIARAFDIECDDVGGIDWYLERQGWAKITGNKVSFVGYTYGKQLTTAQKDEISRLAKAYGGKVEIGFYKFQWFEADRVPLLTDEELKNLCE